MPNQKHDATEEAIFQSKNTSQSPNHQIPTNLAEASQTNADLSKQYDDSQDATAAKSPEKNTKKRKLHISWIFCAILLVVLIVVAYQYLSQPAQSPLPENPHEFTQDQINALPTYDLSEIDGLSSKKLDGQWVVVTGVHSFNGADNATMMIPALAIGTSTYTEIYYYSDKDFALGCLALALDETTVLGKCSYANQNYSIIDAILLKNDTLEPMLTLDSNTASGNEASNNSFSLPDDYYDVSITGDQLIEEANANTARTINAYMGKRVKITDLQITSIETDKARFDLLQPIYFRNSEDLYSISKGSRITVIGSVTEDYGSYCITDAVLVTDENKSTAQQNISDNPSVSANSDIQANSAAYEAGQAAAWKVYNTIFQYGYDCNKVVTLNNSDSQQATDMADGFYDEAVLMVGYTPYNTYTYNTSILSGCDFTVFLMQWKEAGVTGVYIPFASPEERDTLLPALTIQANQLGYDGRFFDGEGNDITMTMDELEAAYS